MILETSMAWHSSKAARPRLNCLAYHFDWMRQFAAGNTGQLCKLAETDWIFRRNRQTIQKKSQSRSDYGQNFRPAADYHGNRRPGLGTAQTRWRDLAEKKAPGTAQRPG
jgi:hypothetical protein